MKEQESIVIEVNNKIYTLFVKSFDNSINIENYLTIDHGNILGELMTMPLVINQISNLKAEIDNQVAEQKVFLKILKSSLEKELKDSKSGGKLPSLNDLEIHINTSEKFQEESFKLTSLEKKAAYIEGFFWSAKSKIDSLNKISSKMMPEEFNQEILEKSVNNVLIKQFNGKI